MEREKKPKHFLHQPEYKGGPKAMTEFIYQQLRYPAAALEAGLEGTVYTEIEIDFKGVVTDVRILQGIGSGCEEETARVLKMLKFDVARNRGVRVTFHKKIKVVFKKPKQQPVVPPAEMQVQYTLTPAATEKTPEKPAETTYSYTIPLK